MPAFFAFCALASGAAAQVRLSPAASAPLGVPALLLGGPAAPAPALTAALAAQAQALAALPAPAAADYLAAEAASPAPAVRAAALLNAARLEPRAEPGVSRESAGGLSELAAAARKEPALAAWFDGAAAPAGLGLEGLTLKRGSWRAGGEKLERLGQGEFGFVDVHPSIPGAVLKTVAHSESILLMSNPNPSATAAQERKTAVALAEADAGPRHFGRARVLGAEVSVRERVYGETLASLSRKKRLGAEESALVHDLLRRLAAAGLKPDDMRPDNVMIGTTLLDPRRRAYLVDGGLLAAATPDLDEEGRYRDLLETPIMLRGRFDPNMGFVEFSKPMSLILAEGLERSSRTTPALRFKGFVKDFLRALVP